MSTAFVGNSTEQRFRISLVSWEKYEQLAAWFEGRHVRLTYDRGELELMTLSHEHEYDKHLLGAVVMMLAYELDVDIHSAGSMTFKRDDLERGLEPDECYWIEHEAKMRGKREYDQHNDPPPDLVLEVEITRSALNRMGIYSALKVPEVWRWDGEQLRFCLLKKGEYAESTSSRSFPMLAAGEVVRFLRMSQTLSETKLLRAFSTWVREQQEQGWPTAPAKTPRTRKRRNK